MKILIVASLAESLITFRGPLIASLRSHKFDVHVAAPAITSSKATHERLREIGAQAHDVTLRRAGISPTADLTTLADLWRLMRRIQPDIVLAYTIKPVIYGMIAAWLARVPRRFALITGLGYAFTSDEGRTPIRLLAQQLYRFSLTRAQHVFFQNPDDQALFREQSILQAGTPSSVVNGSGVDLSLFSPAPLPTNSPVFLLIARLLGDKGVREYVDAARRIRKRFPQIRCLLAGWIDENPDAIADVELQAWRREGVVEFLGRLTDVRPAIASCTVYVLPSYREGTPRTVLEAMAMGRAIITTDAPGCRETVIESVNGFLVPVKSTEALEAAMQRFVTDPSLAARMGAQSRKLAAEKYDVQQVNAEIMQRMGLT